MMKHAILLCFFFNPLQNLPSWKCVFSSGLSKFRNCVTSLFLVSWIFVWEHLESWKNPRMATKQSDSVAKWPRTSPTSAKGPRIDRANHPLHASEVIRRRVKKHFRIVVFEVFFFNPRSFALEYSLCFYWRSDCRIVAQNKVYIHTYIYIYIFDACTWQCDKKDWKPQDVSSEKVDGIF